MTLAKIPMPDADGDVMTRGEEPRHRRAGRAVFAVVGVAAVLVGCGGGDAAADDAQVGPDAVLEDTRGADVATDVMTEGGDDAGDAIAIDTTSGDAVAVDARDVDAVGSDADGACAPNCAGRSCGADPTCGQSCGTCAAGSSCNSAGQCVTGCTPSCVGKSCGNDGCGGSCGTCASARVCNGAGQCVSCTPTCAGRACGSDGCGGSCGTCPAGRSCDASGACVGGCVPSCAGRSCGSDGCGGSCGACGSNAACNADGKCQCNAGFYPSPAGTFCIPPTGSCAGTGVTSTGYCPTSGDWIWCDPVYGLRHMNCVQAGLGGCSTPPGGGGGGACRCAGPTNAISTTGQCGTIGGPPSWDGIYRCNGAFGVIYAVDCREGNPNGYCTTFATGFGTGPSCMCAQCNPYDTTRRVCLGTPCTNGCAVVPPSASSPGTQACR